MRKVLKKSNLNERPMARAFVALSLVASLAAFGCTTNRTHAAGEPYIGGPSVGPSSPTSNNSGSSVPTTPQPMTSSYRGNEQALATPRPHRLTADEAALIMADHLPRVRVLGPVDPGNGSRPYASEGLVTGQVQNSAMLVNPEMTVNSSLTSPGGSAAIISGAGGDTGTSGAAVFTQNLTTATPAIAAIAVTPGMVAAGGTPAVTTSNATVLSAGTVAPTTPSTVTASSTVPPVTMAGTGNVAVRTLNTNTTNNSASSNVRVTTTNGKVVVTNVKSQ